MAVNDHGRFMLRNNAVTLGSSPRRRSRIAGGGSGNLSRQEHDLAISLRKSRFEPVHRFRGVADAAVHAPLSTFSSPGFGLVSPKRL
jgi:hypothetical protein